MDQTRLEKLLEEIKEEQSKMSGKLDSHSASLIDIESKIDAFADVYKQNQRNIERLAKRVETLEDDSGIEPPEEYKIQYKTS